MEFAFRDCAGEEFTESATLQEFHRYITHSAGILLLVDPTTVPGLREQLPRNLSPQGRTRPFDVDQIVSRLIGLLDRVENRRVRRRVKTPLALVLTKADLLRHLTSDAASLFRQPEARHVNGFDLCSCDQQDRALRQLLVDCGQRSLLASIEEKFSCTKLFAVSALGHAPKIEASGSNGEVEQRVGRIQPWRVLDPLVWLFYHYGYIRAMRSDTTCSN